MNVPRSKDALYSVPLQQVGDFQFDAKVADVFPDMISRSVPGYASILGMIGEIAASYVVPGSSVYDLGCSLGACCMAVITVSLTPCWCSAMISGTFGAA